MIFNFVAHYYYPLDREAITRYLSGVLSTQLLGNTDRDKAAFRTILQFGEEYFESGAVFKVSPRARLGAKIAFTLYWGSREVGTNDSGGFEFTRGW